MIADVVANLSTEAQTVERASDLAPPTDPAVFAGIFRKAQDDVTVRESPPLSRLPVPMTVAEQPGPTPEDHRAVAPLDVDDAENVEVDEAPVRAGKKRERVPGAPLAPVWLPQPLPLAACGIVQLPRPAAQAMAAPSAGNADGGDLDKGSRAATRDGLEVEPRVSAKESAEPRSANPVGFQRQGVRGSEMSRCSDPDQDIPRVAAAAPRTTGQADTRVSDPGSGGAPAPSAPDAAPWAKSGRAEPKALASDTVRALPGTHAPALQPRALPRNEQASDSLRNAANSPAPEPQASAQAPTQEPGRRPFLKSDEVPTTPTAFSMRDLTRVTMRTPEPPTPGDQSLPQEAVTKQPDGPPMVVPPQTSAALSGGEPARKGAAEGQGFRALAPALESQGVTGTKAMPPQAPATRKRGPLDALGDATIPSAPNFRAHTDAPTAVVIAENQEVGRQGDGDRVISMMTLKHETHVHLRDPELGELRIGGLSREGAVHVSVRATEAETAHQLATQSAALAQELRSIPGMVTLSVAQTNSSEQERSGAFGAQQGQGREHQPSRGEERAGDQEARRQASRRRVRIVL